MIETLIALLSMPLWLAVAKKKPAPAKKTRQSSRPATKRAPAPVRGRPRGKQKAVVAAKTPEPEPEPEAEPAPPPPPPPPPVQAPQLFSPAAGELVPSLTPSFRWFYVGGATHYQLMWATDAHFHKSHNHILLTTQTAATLPPEEALPAGTTYYWRVSAGNEGGWGPWSPTSTFSTPSL